MLEPDIVPLEAAGGRVGAENREDGIGLIGICTEFAFIALAPAALFVVRDFGFGFSFVVAAAADFFAGSDFLPLDFAVDVDAVGGGGGGINASDPSTSSSVDNRCLSKAETASCSIRDVDASGDGPEGVGMAKQWAIQVNSKVDALMETRAYETQKVTSISQVPSCHNRGVM